jgi:lipoprotein signal peptidase
VLLALLLLAVVLVCVVLIITSQAAGPLWVLLGASSLWLPANNHHLEGPILLTVVRNHGITVSDLAGIGGFLLATAILVRRVARTPAAMRQVPAGWVCGYCCAAFALGACGAWIVG